MAYIRNITYFGSIDGAEDDNIDLSVELDDGRRFGFVAYTPQNVMRLMSHSYPDVLEWVCQGMIVVRRIDEQCITAALHRCLALGIDRWGIQQE